MIRFYLDENIPIAIATQLERHGIECVTTRDLDQLGDSDESHFARAKAMNCVFCTHDSDFLRFAQSGVEHAGLVFGRQHKHSIGDWVTFLSLIHEVYSPDEMHNRIEFLRL